jgi:hypothetical protein
MHHGKCYHCSEEGHWANNCPQKRSGAQWGGKLTRGGCQIRAADTSESRFEERKDDDEKGKGKVKEEEKEPLPDRVERTGIDRWNDEDKKDLVDYLKGKGF